MPEEKKQKLKEYQNRRYQEAKESKNNCQRVKAKEQKSLRQTDRDKSLIMCVNHAQSQQND